MRALFLVLVLANLAFFAWHAGYLGPGPEPKGEPDRLAQQIAPEKIRIIGPAEARKLAPAQPKPQACIEWGSFPPQEFERAQAVLAAMSPPPAFSARRTDEAVGWWVFMPPSATKAAADRLGAELRKLGVTDFFVLNEEGPNRLAISLGVFKTEEGARNYVEALVKRGVKGARAGERDTRLMRVNIVFRNADDALKARIAELRKEFPGQDARDCAQEDRRADEKKG